MFASAPSAGFERIDVAMELLLLAAQIRGVRK